MQISRHWREKERLYRLQGVRYENGTVSLQERPLMQVVVQATTESEDTNTDHKPAKTEPILSQRNKQGLHLSSNAAAH